MNEVRRERLSFSVLACWDETDGFVDQDCIVPVDTVVSAGKVATYLIVHVCMSSCGMHTSIRLGGS